MSDSCAIGILKEDGQVVSIRVRIGGLPEHAGRKLVRHWNTPEKVQALLEDGDRLWLGDDIEEGRYEDHFEPPEDPNFECGAIAHESEEAFVRNRGYYREKDKLQGALTNKEFNEHCGNFYIFDGKDWYVSDYDCDWDQKNDRWLITSGHKSLLEPLAQREYDALQKRLSDPHSTEAKVEEAMASDPEWQAIWRKRQQQRNTKLEAGKRRHALMEKQEDGRLAPRVSFIYDSGSRTSH